MINNVLNRSTVKIKTKLKSKFSRKELMLKLGEMLT